MGIALLVDPEVDEYAAVDLHGFSLRICELRFDLINHFWRGGFAGFGPGDRSGNIFRVLGVHLRVAGGAEGVFESDGGVYFGRDSIGEDGFVSPSLHGLDGAFAKYFVSAFDGEGFNDSFGGDACVEGTTVPSRWDALASSLG